jgi:hypothetical protein
MKIFCVVTLITVILSKNIFAGAWPQKKGSGYYKLSLRFIYAEDFYDESGEKIPLNGTFTDLTVGFYSEYGLFDNLTLTTGILGYRYIEFESNPGPEYNLNSESGIGEAIIGFRSLLFTFEQTVVSGSLNLNIPLGKSTPDGGLLLSSGDFYQGVNMQVGHSFYPLHAFFNIFLAYNNRTEGFSDEFRYGVEGVYTFYTDLSLILKVKAQQPMYNGRDDKVGGLGILLNDQKYIAYGAELVYKLTKNFGLTAFYESGTAGKNIISAPVYTFGVFYAK